MTLMGYAEGGEPVRYGADESSKSDATDSGVLVRCQFVLVDGLQLAQTAERLTQGLFEAQFG